MKFKAGPLEWKTKKQASVFFGGWLKHVVPTHIIESYYETTVLHGLIENHPDSVGKIGCGVDHFEIRSNPVFSNQNTFYLVRNDGSETDFSFRICISGKSKTKWADFCAAARGAISSQILIYKASRFFEVDQPKCWITGVPLLPESCHVDHVVTFDELLRTFISTYAVDVDSAVSESEDGNIVPVFSSKELRESWIDFHRRNAVLDLATAEANMSRCHQ
tara:strand:- start:603 stop:1259 length:657 start_codon:yes stop_codon:yes gene_type:complete